MEESLTVQCPVSSNNLCFIEYSAFSGFLQTFCTLSDVFPKAASAPELEPLAWPSL